jgi:cell volume regulation protein A
VTGATPILLAGVLLAGALVASVIATRLRLPGLLLFLGIGIAVGSDGLGLVAFNDYEEAQRVGVVALSLILFEGGLTSGFREVRGVLRPALSLAFLGTAITAVITGLAAAVLLGVSVLDGLLLGSVLASTDSAATFALLRGSTLRRRLAQTLEGEAGFNDPVAVLLVLSFIAAVHDGHFGALYALGLFARQLAIGVGVGLALGGLAVLAFRRLPFASAGLYPVASLATVAVAYGAAAVAGGSGFLAVYLAGLALGTAAIPARQTVTAFHTGLSFVAQIALFLTLGLLVFPSRLGGVVLEGTIVALVIAFVARPVAVAIATAFARFTGRERLLLGWAGLRGAVPVVLATFPVVDHVHGSVRFFDVVFFAVVLSTLLQGTTIEPLARWLGLTTRRPALPRPLGETGVIQRLGAENVEYAVADDDAIVGLRVRELGLPREAVLNLIIRGREAIPPRGSTRIEAGDRLSVLLRSEVAHEFADLLERWRDGPFERPVRRRPVMRGAAVIFTTRPWDPADGDPGRPDTVLGIEVVERLRSRHDEPGALVALADGRLAVTGRTIAVGSGEQIQRHARRRLTGGDDAQQAWWQEVIGAASR